MKETTKLGSTTKPGSKGSVTKQSAAKPKSAAKHNAMGKPSTKPKLRKAQDQAELLPILERLAQSAEKLAQAAERLAQAAEQPSATTVTEQPEPPDEMLEHARDVIGVMVIDENEEE